MKSFFIKNTIVRSQLRINLWLIIFFSILWTIYSVIILSVISVGIGGEQITLRNFLDINVNDGNWTQINDGGVSTILNYLVIGSPTIIYCSIVSVVFISIGINKEIQTGQILLWMNAKRTRTNIFYSKICSLWATLAIVIAPTIFSTLIFGATATDANQQFMLLLTDCINMIIFIIMMSTIYSLISLAFVNMNYWANLFNSLIITYMLIMTFLNIFYDNGILERFKYLAYIKFVSIQSLFVNVLSFEKPDLPPSDFDWDDGLYKILGDFNIKGQSWGWQYIAPIITLGLVGTISYSNSLIFKNKDLHI